MSHEGEEIAVAFSEMLNVLHGLGDSNRAVRAEDLDAATRALVRFKWAWTRMQQLIAAGSIQTNVQNPELELGGIAKLEAALAVPAETPDHGARLAEAARRFHKELQTRL